MTKQELIEENEVLVDGLINVRDHIEADRIDRAGDSITEILNDYDLDDDADED